MTAKFITTANGNLRLPAAAYKVKGNLIDVRRPKRRHGDQLSPTSYKARFVPHTGQKPIWYDLKTKQQILLAGSQGGKSHIGPIWLWREIERVLAAKTDPTLEVSFGIMAPTLKMLRSSKVGLARMARFLEQRFGWSEEKFLNKQDWRIDLRPLGYPVHIYSGAAARPNSLQGERLEGVWIDEGGMVESRAIYSVAMQRVHGAGRLLITTTPYVAGAAWLKELIEGAEDGRPNILAVRYPSIVNPYFSLEEEKYLRNELGEAHFRMAYLATFDVPEGLVYSDVTYVEPFSIPRNWTRMMAVDPTSGGSDEFAAVWVAYDPYDPETWYIYREFYEACSPKRKSERQWYRGPDEMVEDIWKASVVERWEGDEVGFVSTGERERISRIFVDPENPAVRHNMELLFPDAQVFKPDNSLTAIIDVRAMLRTGRLLVFNNLVDWRFEQTNYAYKRVSEFDPALSGKIRDKYNHLMDCTRYVVRQCDEAKALANPSWA